MALCLAAHRELESVERERQPAEITEAAAHVHGWAKVGPTLAVSGDEAQIDRSQLPANQFCDGEEQRLDRVSAGLAVPVNQIGRVEVPKRRRLVDAIDENRQKDVASAPVLGFPMNRARGMPVPTSAAVASFWRSSAKPWVDAEDT